MYTLLLISFIAGVLTVLAPCILPLLPVVLGRSTQDHDVWRPIRITASLAIAVVLFTLLLKASTVFIDIPPYVWSYISGAIIIFFGLISLFPHAWEKISIKLHLGNSSQKLLGSASQKKGTGGDILLGLALGPVFSSCSPTYFLILAAVLPESYVVGIFYLVAYAVGLSLALLLIAYLGQNLTKRLGYVANPDGWFKRGLGILFILVGIFIATGADKKLQIYILDTGFLDITRVEQRLLTDPMEDTMDEMETEKEASYDPYQEIENPAGFVNSDPFKLKDLVGEKVILLDFMTYSCINCQRTFPYLNAWYDKYKDQGLEIVGIHTPEFAFEQKYENVVAAAEQFGLMFPLVLDNDYATWRAYGNRYWPRKYLIDVHGNIIYDHIGEGSYDETEKQIQNALAELHQVQGLEMSMDDDLVTVDTAETVNFREIESPETYFGAKRQSAWGNVVSQEGNVYTFAEPERVEGNKIYLVGEWQITPEYTEAISEDARMIFKYTAQKVFLVMESENEVTAQVLQDGLPVRDTAGAQVTEDSDVKIQEATLYRLIEGNAVETHTIELKFNEPGARLFAFTFG